MLRTRRSAIAIAVAFAAAPRLVEAEAKHPDRRWYEKAREMQRLADSWQDQSYGAVLVKHDALVGLGPSSVIKDGNPDAHAEREAIKDALNRHGPSVVVGSILYSTSRPCAACERAAASAGVQRMYFGPELQDAGQPGSRQ